jgi:membrane protease YdiL (CAAX protease family)
MFSEGNFGPGMGNPTPLDWLLRSLSAALTEEIFFRLGLMTLFVWMIRFIVRKPAFDKPSLWIGNLLAALVFAGAHLPPSLSVDVPNWNLVVLVVVFNSLAGIVLGWLYVRYCLIAAIFAHFVADFVQHVIPRLI